METKSTKLLGKRSAEIPIEISEYVYPDHTKALENGVVQIGTMEKQQIVLGMPFPLVLVPS